MIYVTNSILAAMHLGSSPVHVPSLWLGYGNDGSGEPQAAQGYRRIPLDFDDFYFDQSYWRNKTTLGFHSCTSGEWSDTTMHREIYLLSDTTWGASSGFLVGVNSGQWSGSNNTYRCRSGTSVVFSYSELGFDVDYTGAGLPTNSHCRLSLTVSQSIGAALLGNPDGGYKINSTYLALHWRGYNPLTPSSTFEHSDSNYSRIGVSAWSYFTASYFVTPAADVTFNSIAVNSTIRAIGMWDAVSGGNLIWVSIFSGTGFTPAVGDQFVISAASFWVGMI